MTNADCIQRFLLEELDIHGTHVRLTRELAAHTCQPGVSARA